MRDEWRHDMRDETFEEFMDNEGSDIYEEVKDWLESAPECVNVEVLVGRSRDEYAMTVCQSKYHG